MFHRLLDRATRAFFRPWAFFSKEFVQLRRQPRLILMLVLGPFAILLLFGLGYNSKPQPIDTILVLPNDLNLPTDVDSYKSQFIPPFNLVGVTRDRAAAVDQLEHQKIDAVVLFPAGAQQTILGGQRATIEVLFNVLDPLQRSWLNYYSYVQTNELNRQVLQRAMQQQEGQPAASERLAAAVLGEGHTIPPSVLVSPFQVQGKNIAPTSPGYVVYFSPGVLALLVQHIAVTFTALALVRERTRGAIEVFRVAPVSSREILFGKFISYFLQTLVLAVVLAVLMKLALNVPFLGSYSTLLGTVALVILASLGLGFLISAVSNSETQAVQLSLLVLIASVFFSGFLVPLDNLIKAVRVVSYVLPVTYGIQALQHVMLRGQDPPLLDVAGLAGIAVIATVIAAISFQRAFQRR